MLYSNPAMWCCAPALDKQSCWLQQGFQIKIIRSCLLSFKILEAVGECSQYRSPFVSAQRRKWKLLQGSWVSGDTRGADCMAGALLHGERRQLLLQEMILLVWRDKVTLLASAHLDLPFVQCLGFCRVEAEVELCQNPHLPPFFLKWWIPIPHLGQWFSQGECMRGEAIRFNVCLDSYYICPNLFLQLPILYLCNYFPNSIDIAMVLLLVTSLVLLYFSPSAHSLKAGTNRYYHRKLHSIWGILLSQIKHDSSWFHVVLSQKLFLLKMFHSPWYLPLFCAGC